MPSSLDRLRPHPAGPRAGDLAPLRARRLDPSRQRALALRRPPAELVGLLALAAVLYLWGLSINGTANAYYAAAVKSMSTSWHDFLYGSLDSSGVMTVDKPPLAFWVQALSVRAFGFSSLSLLVPQALMGVASVGLTYGLVRRRFGRLAGAVGGLALAVTPIAVAVSRHNNPDALLVLCSVGALYATVRALEAGGARWLALAGVCVGLGFETKMGAALLVVPGIVAAWLWVAPRGRLATLRGLGAFGAAAVVVGGAWPLLVALTPAADRPWISGTSDNSIWSLVLGYNGLGRLDGQAGGAGGGGMGGGNSMFGGDTGVLRLLNDSLGGQAGWLLGFAVVGLVGLGVVTRLRRSDPRTGWLVAVGGALLTSAAAFSFARGIFHPYYVSLLAPFAAALVGATAGWLVSGDVAARTVAPLAVAGGVVAELIVLGGASRGTLTWLAPVLVIGGLAGAGALAWLVPRRSRTIALAAVLGLLAIAPASWAVDTLGHPANGTFPAGGPAAAGMGGGPGGAMGRGGPGARNGAPGRGARPSGAFAGAPPSAPGGASTGGSSAGGPARAGMTRAGGPGAGGAFGGGASSLTSAFTYVAAHGGGTIAVSSQSTAASAILAGHSNVVGIGGFSGNESAVSVAWLARQVRSGAIRWVLVDSSSAGPGGGRGISDGRVGATKVLAAAAKVGVKARTTSAGTLYDLQGKAAALASAQ